MDRIARRFEASQGMEIKAGHIHLFGSHNDVEDLPYSHTDDTYCHMKTTLNIDDTVMAELKREAARQGRTMSELVESASACCFARIASRTN